MDRLSFGGSRRLLMLATSKANEKHRENRSSPMQAVALHCAVSDFGHLRQFW